MRVGGERKQEGEARASKGLDFWGSGQESKTLGGPREKPAGNTTKDAHLSDI